MLVILDNVTLDKQKILYKMVHFFKNKCDSFFKYILKW
jgi:hypothetical protein